MFAFDFYETKESMSSCAKGLSCYFEICNMMVKLCSQGFPNFPDSWLLFKNKWFDKLPTCYRPGGWHFMLDVSTWNWPGATTLPSSPIKLSNASLYFTGKMSFKFFVAEQWQKKQGHETARTTLRISYRVEFLDHGSSRMTVGQGIIFNRLKYSIW